MSETPAVTSKRERIETLLRVLSVVILVASVVGTMRPHANDRLALALGSVLLVWIIISSVGARLGVGGGSLKSWWVVGIDVLLIASAILIDSQGIDELAALALAVPVGIMTLRGQLTLSVALALVATVIAYLLVRECFGRQPDGSTTVTIEVVAHTLAWFAIYALVAFSSRAGFRFLQVADLQMSEAEQRLQRVLDSQVALLEAEDLVEAVRRITHRAREIFTADTASIMRTTEDGIVLVGLSRADSYFDGSRDAPPDPRGSVARASVSIADYVAFSKAPLLLNEDRANDARFRNMPSRSGIRSAMCVPVTLGPRLLGVLNVSRLEETLPEFTQSDLRVAVVLGHLSAVALSQHEV